MYGLRLMFVFFGFCLVLFWLFFGLDLEKTKKTHSFLVFWIKRWLRRVQKQKNSRFFGFSLRSQKETKATNTQKPKKTSSFFGFSQFFNHHVIQKNKKH